MSVLNSPAPTTVERNGTGRTASPPTQFNYLSWLYVGLVASAVLAIQMFEIGGDVSGGIYALLVSVCGALAYGATASILSPGTSVYVIALVAMTQPVVWELVLLFSHLGPGWDDYATPLLQLVLPINLVHGLAALIGTVLAFPLSKGESFPDRYRLAPVKKWLERIEGAVGRVHGTIIKVVSLLTLAGQVAMWIWGGSHE